jgi:hypothetical protein
MKTIKFGRLPSPRLEPEGQRRSSYVDGRIQGRLVAAILLFEVLLISAGMLFLYYHLNQVMENQMFRIHPGRQEGQPILVQHLMVVIPAIVVANVMLVALIEWLWSGYISKIIWPLRHALQAVALLDLRYRPAPVVEHEVLDKAGDWIQVERLRCAQLRQLVEELDAGMDASDAKRLLDEMRRCLPDAPDQS